MVPILILFPQRRAQWLMNRYPGNPKVKTPTKNKRFPDALEFHMHWSGVDDPELDGDAGHTSTSSSPCSTIGRRSRYSFGYTEIFVHAVDDDVVMNPTPRKPSRSFNIGQGSQPRAVQG